MFKHVTTAPPPFTPAAWLGSAAASIAAGVIFYALGRPYVPEAIHTALLNFDVTAQILPSAARPLAYQLPSFFHMLALLLATVGVTWHQPKLRNPSLLVTFLLGMTMEFVQHPAVKNNLQACTDSHLCSLFPGAQAYAIAGTFDRLDVLAIMLAAFTTYLLLRLKRTP